MSNKPILALYPIITPDQLDRMMEGNCPCCNEPFSVDNAPDLTSRCCAGPLYVGYWDGYLYLRCGQCEKPVGKIKVAL